MLNQLTNAAMTPRLSRALRAGGQRRADLAVSHHAPIDTKVDASRSGFANSPKEGESKNQRRENPRPIGLKVQAEIYPYNFGATIVGADYLVPSNYGPNMGRTYKDIIETATLKPLTKERYEELMKTNRTASVMFYGISEQGMLDALAHPSTFVGSDAFPMTVAKTGRMAVDWNIPFGDVQGHPRAAGSHAKVLKLVREKNLMPLMLAISKMSYMPAKFMEDNGVPEMARKGRLKVGTDADITIFDPGTVRDNATIEKNGLPSTGIPYVVVNGTTVVKDSKVLKDVFPGQPIRNAMVK